MHDYHIHTTLCKHAYHDMAEYIKTAISRGITELCFTDHIPLPDDYDNSHRMEPDEMDLYLENIEKCRTMFPEISIFTGIEADYIDRYESYLRTFFKKYSFDLIILSIHFIDSWPEHQWVFDFNFPGRSMPEIYHDYFITMNRAINTGLFNIVGHMDLIKRPGYPVWETNRNDIEMIFDSLIKHQMSIEINTSGLRREINQTYPSLEIIEAAAKRGIPIALASDAHLPEHVGHAFKDIMFKIKRFQNLKLLSLSPKKRIATSFPNQ